MPPRHQERVGRASTCCAGVPNPTPPHPQKISTVLPGGNSFKLKGTDMTNVLHYRRGAISLALIEKIAGVY